MVNDYNDRAIREGVKYFDSILSSSENENCKAILITNDMANSVRLSPLSPSLPLRYLSHTHPLHQTRAREDQLSSHTLKSYVHKYLHQYPELFDLLADEVSRQDHILPSK